MEQLLIFRNEWQRGHGNGSLYNPVQNVMCCLGFYCVFTKNIPIKYVTGVGMPSYITNFNKFKNISWLKDNIPILTLEEKLSKEVFLELYFNIADYWENILATVNDSRNINDVQRERILTELFALKEVEVFFKDSRESLFI